VADYVLFRLEQISRHLVRLADNMQVFDTASTKLTRHCEANVVGGGTELASFLPSSSKPA